MIGTLLYTKLALFLFRHLQKLARQAAHNFGHDNEDWGGKPVVILFGDDHQLPTVVHAGAFYVSDSAMTADERHQF